jgi:hypothetical protein
MEPRILGIFLGTSLLKTTINIQPYEVCFAHFHPCFKHLKIHNAIR